MARIKQGDEYFEIPDDDFTAPQLQEKAKKDKDAVPVVIRGDKDIVVEPNEVVHLQPDDRVIFTTPVRSGMALKLFSISQIKGVFMDNSEKMVTLVFKDEDYELMLKHLLKDDENERVSFILFGIKGADAVQEAYVHKIINLEDSEYSHQSAIHVVPEINSQLKAFKAFYSSEVFGFLHVHSHPFTDIASFSTIDIKSVPKTVRSLKDYLIAHDKSGNFLYGTLVIGRKKEGFTGCIYDALSVKKAKIGEIKTIGKEGVRKIRSYLSNSDKEQKFADTEVLDRNIKWLGEEGQKRLSETSLVISGTGGVGGLVALNARGLGLKKITLIDDDLIEKSNLNRLPAATLSDVGEYKVKVIERMIKDVSPHTEVETITEKVSYYQGQGKQVISEADIVIAAVDSFEARNDIQFLAARYMKPLIDIGAGINLNTDTSMVEFMGGQIACYLPGGPCLCCQGIVPRNIESKISQEVRRFTGYVKGTNITPTSVVTINSIVAGYAIDMVIKFITGFSKIKTHIKVDLLNMTAESFNFQKKQNCFICGENGIEGQGDEIISSEIESLTV